MTSVRRRRLRGMGEHYTHTVGRPLDRYVRLAVGYRYAGVRPAVQPSRWRVENDLAFVQDGVGRRDGSLVGMTTRTDHHVWPGLSYDDAQAARAWLAALGFEPGICVEASDGEHAGEIQHSEMVWPEGGRVMVQTRGKADESFTTLAGNGNVYVVCDDPDAVWVRAQALGATVLRPMEDTDYGSRGFSVGDAEGNAWSFGTYAGDG